MKIAITKIGAAISFGQANSSAACADILYAMRTLKGKDNKFTICTKPSRNTVLPKSLEVRDITKMTDFNDFDCVFVFNGSINFFGGGEDLSLLSLYKALAKTRKTIYYINTDGMLSMARMWYFVERKMWAHKYSAEEFDIDGNNVIYLTQGRNVDAVTRKITAKNAWNAIVPRAVVHVPWERTILTDWEKHYPNNDLPLARRTYDLGFGGYSRNSYKRHKIEYYYDTQYLRTLLFGNLKDVKLHHTKITNMKVPFQQMVKVMSDCKATVIIGDQHYSDNFHTLRMYEGILAGCLVLIDKDLDPKMKFYEGADCIKTYYVSTQQDVQEALDSFSLEDLADDARWHIIDGYDQDTLRSQIMGILYAYTV